MFWGRFPEVFALGFDQWVELRSCHVRGDVLSHCTLKLQEIRQQQLFLSQPAIQHVPQQFLHAVTFYFYRGHIQPTFSCVLPARPTDEKILQLMQVFVVCKVEAFVSSKKCWLSGASVGKSPAESTLPLPACIILNF